MKIKPVQDYWELDKKNREEFEKILEVLSPDVYYIYKAMRDNKITANQIMEIVYKIGIANSLDDGYGKIFIDIQGKRIRRIKLIQEKILKPSKEELEVIEEI